MPWHIGKHSDCEGIAVIKDSDGTVAGCHETEDEAKAQMAALYANEPTAEQEPGGPETCVCPDCDYEAEKERGVPCRSMECPECGAMLVAKEGDMGEKYQIDSTAVIEALTKDGHPRGDHLVQGEADDPSTWHLPVKTDGKVDRRLLGAAKAALTVGYRGNKYEGPDKAAALRKLKAMYDAEGLEWTAAESAVEQARTLIEQALELLSNIQEDAEPMAESTLTETATGHVIGIEEAEVKTGKLVPMTLDVVLIEPGPGNAKDGHYYPAEVLRRDAAVFKGAKMYATDHRQEDKSVGTWVSTVKACPVGFTETGGPIARVVVHKPWFAQDIQTLREADLLNRMECSIIGTGKAKKAKVGEVEYNVVEAITQGGADWVTQAGAGGRALALAESDTISLENGGEDVDEKEKVQESEAETVTLREEETGEQPLETQTEPEAEPEATQEEPPAEAALPDERVDELLKESGLGEDAVRLLSVGAYKSEQAVQDAVAEFKRIIKRASGSGQPFAQGKTEPAQETKITEADREQRFNEIVTSYGCKPIPVREVK